MLTLAFSTVHQKLNKLVDYLTSVNFPGDIKILIINQCIDIPDEFVFVPPYVDDNIVTIKTFYEKGISKSRNRAIEHCTTDYIWFLDDDIEFVLSELVQLTELLKNTHDDLCIVKIGSLEDKHKYYKDYSRRHYGVINKQIELLRISSIEIVAKHKFLVGQDIKFDERLGLGTQYPCCEENNFLIDSFKHGAKIANIDITPILHTTKREHRLTVGLGHYFARGYTASRFNVVIKWLLIIRWSVRRDVNVSFNKRATAMINGLPNVKHLYIISPYESPAEARGTRNIFLSKLCGNQCTLVCTRFSHGKKKMLPKEDFSKNYPYLLNTIPTITYKKNLSIKRMFAHWVTAFSVFFYLLKNAKRGNKVLLSSIPPEVLLLSLLITKIKKIDCVIDVRDIWPDAFPLTGLIGKVFHRYCNILYKIAFRLKTCKFIYVAPSFKQWIESKCPEKNITDMYFGPLGYDKSRWALTAIKSNEWLFQKKIRLVYVGYLESQFDITDVIAAVKENDNYELLIIGNGSKQKYYEHIAANNIRISFLGLLPPGDVALKLTECHIGILPISQTAQMPNKLFDYLGAKLPVLAIGDSDSSKFVLDKNIGWSCNFSTTQLAKILSTINFDDINIKYRKLVDLGDVYSKENNYIGLMDYILNDH